MAGENAPAVAKSDDDKPAKKERSKTDRMADAAEAFGKGMKDAASQLGRHETAIGPAGQSMQVAPLDLPSMKRGGKAKKGGMFRLHKGERIAGKGRMGKKGESRRAGGRG